ASSSRFVYATSSRRLRRDSAANVAISAGTASRVSSQTGEAKLIRPAPAHGESCDDLGRRTDHPREPRHRDEGVLACAEFYVGFEPRRAVSPGVETVERGRERAGEQLGGDRGVAALAVEAGDDAAGAVRVVERERPHEPGAVDDDVTACRARRVAHRVEVEQRAEEDDVAAGGGGDDRRGAVRRREDEVACDGSLREIARRCADVEPVDDDTPALAADDGIVAELRPELAGLVDLAAAQHPLVSRCER